MLQRIRDNASGPIAYFIVGLIALVFGVWGIGSYFTPSSDPVVASVGSTNITQSQLRQGFNQRYAQLRQMMGDNFKPDLLPADQLRRSVLQDMIQDAVLQQYARQADYRVTSADVLAQLQSNPQFQQDGKFSAQRYRALLGQAGIAPANYEASLRQGLRNQAVQNIITGSAFAAPAEVSQAYRLVNQQRRVSFLAFDPAVYKKQVNVGPDEVDAYYQAHPKRFMRPQRVQLSYVVLSRQNAGSAKPPTEQALRALYEKNKQTLGTPEKRSADEIRVPVDSNNPGAARDTIQKVAAAAQDGTAFAKIAQAIKPAQSTRIDASAQGALPEAVGSALFGLKNQQLSTPVRGDSAWYLLRQTGVTPASTPAFNDPRVQARLKAIAATRQASQAYRRKADQMDDLAYQAPNDLRTLSSKLGLDIQHTGWISRGNGSGIGQYDAVRKAAFSDSVLKDKLNSTVISLGDDRHVVLRVDSTQKAQRKPLDAVKRIIRQRLVTQKASAMARDTADQLLKTLRDGNGQTLKAVAGANPGVALKSPGYIKRANDSVDPRIVEAAFSMSPPEKDRSGYQIATTSTGRVAIVAVNGIREAGKNEAQPDENQPGRQRFADDQQNYIAGLEFASLSDYLRASADVTIHRDEIQ